MWIPVGLLTLYYGVPVLLHPTAPIAVVIAVPAVIAAAACRWRRSQPLTAFVVALACLLASPAALGGVVGILASRARHLPSRRTLPELFAWSVAAVVVKVVQLLGPLGGGGWSPVSSVELTISSSAIGFAVLAGLLARSSTRSAVSQREAEQARANEVRLEERARIAREMHDVVAHRISLVAMTSGALVYRDDLPDDAREAVTIIQTNARQALTEMRALLSDLRGGDGAPTTPETPQPTLEQLPVLLAEAREVTDIASTCDIDPVTLPTTTSRQLYRIVQEGLTNARKHAPGQPVSVHVGRDGDDIVATIRNPMNDGDQEWGTRGGYGLVGVQERARLLGGTARVEVVDGRFVLTVRVPAKVAS